MPSMLKRTPTRAMLFAALVAFSEGYLPELTSPQPPGTAQNEHVGQLLIPFGAKWIVQLSGQPVPDGDEVCLPCSFFVAKYLSCAVRRVAAVAACALRAWGEGHAVLLVTWERPNPVASR